MFKTQIPFVLPKGYIDKDGNLHREGIMRYCTAGDTILPLGDIRVKTNPAYLSCILFSRIIIKLGTLEEHQITPKLIEDLPIADLNFLKILYEQVNVKDDSNIKVTCPKCENQVEIDLTNLE